MNSRSVTLNSSRIEIDVGRFESLVAERTPNSLSKAVRLYQDEMLAGFYLPEDTFEEWLFGEQQRLLDMAIVALDKLLHHQFDDLYDAAAIETARRLLALDPLQEPVHRTVMRLHYRAGRKSAAVRQYQTCARVLRRELGIEPDMATDALYREIVSDRSSMVKIRDAQNSDTGRHDLERVAYSSNPTEDNLAIVKQSFLYVINLDKDYKPPDTRLDWVQVKDANQDWNLEPEANEISVSETLKTGMYSVGYFGKAVDALSAIFLWIKPNEQEAAERRQSYHDRTLVAPPSMTRPCCGADPWSMIISGYR